MAVRKPHLYFVSDIFSENVENTSVNQRKSSGGKGIAAT